MLTIRLLELLLDIVIVVLIIKVLTNKHYNYLRISDSVILHTCALANLKGLLQLNTRFESSFLSDGFRN